MKSARVSFGLARLRTSFAFDVLWSCLCPVSFSPHCVEAITSVSAVNVATEVQRVSNRDVNSCDTEPKHNEVAHES